MSGGQVWVGEDGVWQANRKNCCPYLSLGGAGAIINTLEKLLWSDMTTNAKAFCQCLLVIVFICTRAFGNIQTMWGGCTHKRRRTNTQNHTDTNKCSSPKAALEFCFFFFDNCLLVLPLLLITMVMIMTMMPLSMCLSLYVCVYVYGVCFIWPCIMGELSISRESFVCWPLCLAEDHCCCFVYFSLCQFVSLFMSVTF